jgi:hypothetical protein
MNGYSRFSTPMAGSVFVGTPGAHHAEAVEAPHIAGQTAPSISHELRAAGDEDDAYLDQSMVSNAGIHWSTPKRVALILMVCGPIACFWALNLSSVANITTQSVTMRMYITKLACLLLENSVQFLSESKLDGAGRRTKHVVFSAIFGLAIAVLTTISEIDSRADGGCDWQASYNDPSCRSSGVSNGTQWIRFSWCCAMVRNGDFLSRPLILSSAALASAAALWGWLAAALTASPAIALGGSGGLAVGSAALLGWGARGDEDAEWLLLAPAWLAALAAPVALLASPLPFWYDGVAVTAGVVGSTSRVRRAMAAATALADAAALPAVRGGAIAAMGVALVARMALSLALAAAPACLAPRARAAAERAAGSAAARAAAAAAAARRGLVGRDGRIAAAHVFEFDPAGPHVRWWWIRKGGVRRGRFAVRPLDEYRLGSAAGSRLPPAAAAAADGDPSRAAAGIWVIRLPGSESVESSESGGRDPGRLDPGPILGPDSDP